MLKRGGAGYFSCTLFWLQVQISRQSGGFLLNLPGAICIPGVDGQPQRLPLRSGWAACPGALLNASCAFPSAKSSSRPNSEALILKIPLILGWFFTCWQV